MKHKILFFIGFKASGKTTLGKALAKRLSVPFIDLDQWVEKSYQQAQKQKASVRDRLNERDRPSDDSFLLDDQMEGNHALAPYLSCYEIFKKEGEGKFRELEKKVLLSLEKISNAVIATGGGTVLLPEFATLLKKDPKVLCIYLNPPFEVIEKRILEQKANRFLDEKNPQKAIRSHWEKREIFYRKRAHLRFSCNAGSVEEDCAALLERINAR